MNDTAVSNLAPISREGQLQHLAGVSRTFALTIPMLPSLLADTVANAYLLCRIADTVEDDPLASNEDKIAWLKDFSRLSSSNFRDAALMVRLQNEALLLIKDGAKKDEYHLVEDMCRVIVRTKGYHSSTLKIISRGVEILSSGMAEHLKGVKIKSLDDVDSYCYSVAGVVGQMLSHLFASFNRNINDRELAVLAVSFGEGLQLTNILKDRFSDEKERKVSYIPTPEKGEEQKQLAEYAAIAQGHLDDAVVFVLKIPRLDAGIRLFCLLNIIMAVLTLKKITKNPCGPGSLLKISRRCVKASAAACTLAVRSNLAVKFLVFVAGFGSVRHRRDVQQLHDKVNLW